jgi:hypothetical protein
MGCSHRVTRRARSKKGAPNRERRLAWERRCLDQFILLGAKLGSIRSFGTWGSRTKPGSFQLEASGPAALGCPRALCRDHVPSFEPLHFFSHLRPVYSWPPFCVSHVRDFTNTLVSSFFPSLRLLLSCSVAILVESFRVVTTTFSLRSA